MKIVVPVKRAVDYNVKIRVVEPLAVARLLKGVVEEPEFVIVGKQAINDDSNQTGQMPC